MSPEATVLLALFIPLASVFFIAANDAHPNRRELATLLASLLLLGAVLSLLPAVAAGARPTVDLLEFAPGLPLRLSVEPLGMTFAAVAALLWPLNSLYSIGYMRGNQEHHQTRFYVCFAIAIASAIGIAFAGNLLTLFIFYEALTLSTYPLVTHKGNADAMRAGRLYLGILLGTSIGLLLLAIIWTGWIAGTLDFTPGGILAGKVEGPAAAALLALYMFGIGKAALMPFHRWLPAAMVAPTPVSALLHAVAVVKAGVFTVMKVIVYVFGIDFLSETGASQWLMWVAALTVLLASCVALTKDNLKARLAYSTVSQLGYVVLGAALATSMGVIGGSMQIVMHAMGKITLFFCAGAIYTATHKTEISQMDGLGRVMPFTFGAFLIGALEHRRAAAAGGFLEQVVFAGGDGGCRTVGDDGGVADQFAAERGLPAASGGAGVFRRWNAPILPTPRTTLPAREETRNIRRHRLRSPEMRTRRKRETQDDRVAASAKRRWPAWCRCA